MTALFTTRGQATAFLIAVYGGMAIGLLYDAARVTRYALRAGHTVTLALDLLFWLGAAAVMFLALLRSGMGELRGHMLAGYACGWFLYALALSHWVMSLYRLLRRLSRHAAHTELGRRLFR